jgi:6-phosphofructokinase 1
MEACLAEDLRIPQLGECGVDSPGLTREWGAAIKSWVDDQQRILLDDRLSCRGPFRDPELRTVELAGPRRKVYFEPEKSTFAVVTCGGICPGINDVIRSLVMHAHHGYGVRRFLGIPFGFEGLNPALGHLPIGMGPESVSRIHHLGGSVLGTSRGMQDPVTMLETLDALAVNALFVVGGDGSQRGAWAIHEAAQRRGRPLAVVGIPKTIDNDLRYMDRSFGHLTAFSEAFRSITVAHAEARGARRGVGLVRLMGRDSGFIACSAALATAEANFVLIPEVPFAMEGAHGLLACLERRLESRGHALVVVAEGAGQHFFPPESTPTDPSGNRQYGDIGRFLKEAISLHFKALHRELNLKYMDPTYQLRGVVATPEDRIFCLQLARHAVHAAMSGKTGLVVALRHNRFVHLPMPVVTRGRNRVDPEGDLWRCVLESTGQPARMV